MSTRLRNALQLPTINQDTLVINKFGSETGQIQSRDLVQICVQGMTSETYLYILRVDTCDQSVDESSENRALERKLAEFWDLEAIGNSPEEKAVYERFNEDITFMDGRYEVKLPWKECDATLPDNYTLCQRRLKSLTRRLQSEEITQEYDAVIQDQLD